MVLRLVDRRRVDQPLDVDLRSDEVVGHVAVPEQVGGDRPHRPGDDRQQQRAAPGQAGGLEVLDGRLTLGGGRSAGLAYG